MSSFLCRAPCAPQIVVVLATESVHLGWLTSAPDGWRLPGLDGDEVPLTIPRAEKEGDTAAYLLAGPAGGDPRLPGPDQDGSQIGARREVWTPSTQPGRSRTTPPGLCDRLQGFVAMARVWCL